MRTALSLLLIASAFLTTSCAPSAPVDNRATEAAPEAKSSGEDLQLPVGRQPVNYSFVNSNPG